MIESADLFGAAIVGTIATATMDVGAVLRARLFAMNTHGAAACTWLRRFGSTEQRLKRLEDLCRSALGNIEAQVVTRAQ